MSPRILVLALATLLVPAAALSAEEKANATLLKAKRYIADLANPEFQTRENATRELIKIGHPALPLLKEALKSEILEVRSRAQRIIKAIQKTSPEPQAKKGQPGSLEDLVKRLLKDSFRPPREKQKPGAGSFEEFFKTFEKLFETPPHSRDPKAWQEFWKKWRERQARFFPRGMEDLRKWREKMDEEMRRLREQQKGEGNRGGHSSSVTILPNGRVVQKHVRDGVTVEIVREPDGSIRMTVREKGQTPRTFQATSERELREKHPEAYAKYYRRGSPFRLRWTGPRTPRPRRTPPARKPDSTTGFLGLKAGPVETVLQKHLGLAPGEGALVTAVVPGSPAAKLGLQAYDIVLTVNGEAVASARDLYARLAATRRSQTPVAFTAVRRAKRIAWTSKR